MNQDNTEEKPPRLLRYTEVDEIDKIEEYGEKYKNVQSIINGQTEIEIHSKLQSIVSESNEKHQNIIAGLLFGILTQPEQSDQLFNFLNNVVRDGHSFTMNFLLSQILNEKHSKFPRLTETSQTQMFWLAGELVRVNVEHADVMCLRLLQCISSVDLSSQNLNLMSKYLQMMNENKEWFYSKSLLLATTVYSVMRMIFEHHHRGHTTELFRREIAFVTSALNEKFMEIMTYGRDFVRMLYFIREIKEFKDIWSNMVHQPQNIDSHFTGIRQILGVPTKRQILHSRVPPEMERGLLFMMNEVKNGTQRRYQQWFVQKYLPNDAESVIIDLVRYICGVFHPSNQQIASGYVPRYAMIGWLLKCVKNKRILYFTHNAVFFDWLCWNREHPKENLMNLEPGILLLVNSIPKYMDITKSLLSFLLNLDNFHFYGKNDESVHNLIRSSLRGAFKILLEKKVVTSFSPLLDCPHLEQSLRDKLRWVLEDRPSSKKPSTDSSKQQQQQQSISSPPQQQKQQQQQPKSPSKQPSPPEAPGSPSSSQHPKPFFESSPPQSPLHQHSKKTPSEKSELKQQQQPSSLSSSLSPPSSPSSSSYSSSPKLPLQKDQQQQQQQQQQQKQPSKYQFPKQSQQSQQEGISSLSPSQQKQPDISSISSSPSKIQSQSPLKQQQQQKQKQQLKPSPQKDQSDQIKPLETSSTNDQIFPTKKESGGLSSGSSPPSPGPKMPFQVSPSKTETTKRSAVRSLKQSKKVSSVSEELEPLEIDKDARYQPVTTIPSALSVFEPHISNFAEKAFQSRKEASESLKQIFSVYDNQDSTKYARELSLFLMRVLSFEFSLSVLNKKPAEIVFNENSLLFTLFDLFRDRLEPMVDSEGKVKSTLTFRFKERRYASFMRHAQNQEPSLGYRLLCYCLLGDNTFDTDDIILSQNHVFSMKSFLRSVEAKHRNVDSGKEKDVKTKCWLYLWFTQQTFLNSGNENKPQEQRQQVQFLSDIQSCFEDCPTLLGIIVPPLYDYLDDLVVGNIEFIRKIVFYVTPAELQDLCFMLAAGRIEIIGEDHLTSIIQNSLEWDAMEQLSFWEILQQEISSKSFDAPELMRNIFEMDEFDPKVHKECMSKLLTMVRVYEPSFEIFSFVATLSPAEYGRFPSCLMLKWSETFYDVCLDHIMKLCKMFAKDERYKKEKIENGIESENDNDDENGKKEMDETKSIEDVNNSMLHLIQLKYAEQSTGEGEGEKIFESDKLLNRIKILHEKGVLTSLLYKKLTDPVQTANGPEDNEDSSKSNTVSSVTTRAQNRSHRSHRSSSDQRSSSSSSTRNKTTTHNYNNTMTPRKRRRRIIGQESDSEEEEEEEYDMDDTDDIDEPANKRKRYH